MPRAGVETAAARLLRSLTFAVAIAASLTLMLFPFLLRHVEEARLHAALPLALLGVAGALVHGVGYRPEHGLLRILFGPICAWTLMAGGTVLLLA